MDATKFLQVVRLCSKSLVQGGNNHSAPCIVVFFCGGSYLAVGVSLYTTKNCLEVVTDGGHYSVDWTTGLDYWTDF